MQHDIVITDVQTVSCNLRIFVTRVDEQTKSLTSELLVHTLSYGYFCIFPQLNKSKVGNNLSEGVWIDRHNAIKTTI